MSRTYHIAYAALSSVTLVVMSLVNAVFRFLYGRGKTVARVEDPLLLIPAHKLADRIRTRQVGLIPFIQFYFILLVSETLTSSRLKMSCKLVEDSSIVKASSDRAHPLQKRGL